MFSNFNISASGLTAQRLRMDVIAENIANANTTRAANGGPYRKKIPVFQERTASFKNVLSEESQSQIGSGVEIARVVEDQSPFKMIYNPAHPDANRNGYVAMPNVDITTEMVDLIDASRAYEANVTALNSYKKMALKAIEIGRG